METQRDRLLDAEGAAALLGIRPSTIRSWWSTGKLQRVKIGYLTRVWESEILALIPPKKLDPAKPSARQNGAVSGITAPTPSKDSK